MAEFQISLEEIRKSQRDLALLETQCKLKQDIEQMKVLIQSSIQSSLEPSHHSKSFEYKLGKSKKALEVLERKLDYYLKFKQIYGTIDLYKKKSDIIRTEIWTIESQIREKYRKMADDEIIEKTSDLRSEMEECCVKVSQHRLKPKDCIHCDVSGLLFSGMKCFMCDQTIRFAS